VQTPSLGRVVIVLVEPTMNNGSDVASASITRVWSKHPDGDRWTINAKVTLDSSGGDLWKTSIGLFDTEEQARANGPHSAFWPPRV
jgi:hypothetical protein